MNEGEPRPGGGIRRWAKAVVTLPGMSALIMLIIIAVGFQIWTEIFLNPRNLNLILGIVPELGVVVLGVTLLMIAREFDLSVGSVFAALRDVDLHLRSPDTPVDELSGGERQGVTIARAMYFKTKIMILDEPTNHLSIKETNKVLGWVEEMKGQGITSVFITHNLHHIYPIADRIVVLSRGEVTAEMRKEDTSIEELTDLII